jgi:hypothetical protein
MCKIGKEKSRNLAVKIANSGILRVLTLLSFDDKALTGKAFSHMLHSFFICLIRFLISPCNNFGKIELRIFIK